ncbi:T9SS type A sorting domain-containing protein [Lewinella sp. IMCC34191]|uniref:T9SS type A sorting domain-containing protein n=1 Tax=Lewinella sp. IMCC34191 TaxID=2259172 RepID=UPI000E26C7DC|nr:T9SS type A sorting domain-containing protein [Lewinella sp. IMCC34191]
MLFRTLLTAFAVLIACTHLRADNYASVTSSEGWTITVAIRYTGITVLNESNNCRYGFNYVQNFDYEVHYSGGGGPRTYYLGIGDGCVTNGGTIGIPESSSLSGSIQSYNKYSNTKTPCHRIDPADFACETMNLTISAPGVPNQTVSMAYMDGNAVLPIALSDFGAESEPTGSVRVHWNTVEQADQNYFTVERSANGSDWLPLATLPSRKGNDVLGGYQFRDEHPLSTVAYYRIVMMSVDGTSTISDIRAVHSPDDRMSVYPNPVSDVLYLRGFDEVTIFDMQGRDVTSQLTPHHTGDGTYSVNVSGLKKGVYFARSAAGAQRFQRI